MIATRPKRATPNASERAILSALAWGHVTTARAVAILGSVRATELGLNPNPEPRSTL